MSKYSPFTKLNYECYKCSTWYNLVQNEIHPTKIIKLQYILPCNPFCYITHPLPMINKNITPQNLENKHIPHTCRRRSDADNAMMSASQRSISWNYGICSYQLGCTLDISWRITTPAFRPLPWHTRRWRFLATRRIQTEVVWSF